VHVQLLDCIYEGVPSRERSVRMMFIIPLALLMSALLKTINTYGEQLPSVHRFFPASRKNSQPFLKQSFLKKGKATKCGT
jgi:hypothetical protein